MIIKPNNPFFSEELEIVRMWKKVLNYKSKKSNRGMKNKIKVFVITTTANLSPKDIQDYIWMNVDGNFSLSVAELAFTNPPDIGKQG